MFAEIVILGLCKEPLEIWLDFTHMSYYIILLFYLVYIIPLFYLVYCNESILSQKTDLLAALVFKNVWVVHIIWKEK